MRLRPGKTIWVGLLCLGVLGYLLLLGQINIRQFEAKLTQRSQDNLLQLARVGQRHYEDLIGLFSDYLRATAEAIDRSDGDFSSAPIKSHLASSLLDSAALSFDRIDLQGNVTDHFGRQSAGLPLYQPPAAIYGQGGAALDSVYLEMDARSEPPCLVLFYPLSEGTTLTGALALRLSAEYLLTRLNTTATAQEVQTCLVSGQGDVLTARYDRDEAQPAQSLPPHIQGPFLLADIRQRCGGVGTLRSDSRNATAEAHYLVGQRPLEGFNSPWSIAVIQSDRSIKKAVAEHARGIQLGMVCLFVAVFLIWLLYYRSARRRIVFEQQTALGQATQELHHLSEQSRQNQQQLERQIALYRAILNAVPMGLYWKDSEGRLIGYNSEYAHIAGCKPMNNGAVPIRTEMFEQQQEGLPLDMEVMNKDIELLFLPQTYGKSNYFRNYLVSKIPVKDKSGAVSGLLGSLLNEDLLKTAQQRSFCTSLRSRCVTESMPASAMLINRQGYLLHANAAFWKRLGMEPPPDVQKAADLLDLKPPDMFEQTMRSFAQTTDDHAQGFYLRRGGDCFWTAAQPIYENGKLNGMLALLTDVSHLKNAEEFLEKLLYRHRRLLGDLRQQLDKLTQTAQNATPENAAQIKALKFSIDAWREKFACFDSVPEEPTDVSHHRPEWIDTAELVETLRRRIVRRDEAANEPMDITVGKHCPGRFQGPRQRLTEILTLLLDQAVQSASDKTVSMQIDYAPTDARKKTIQFTLQHAGLLRLGTNPVQPFDPDCPLPKWYEHCPSRDQALGLRIAARLLRQIGSTLQIEQHSDRTCYRFDLPVEPVLCDADASPEALANFPQSMDNQENTHMQENDRIFDSERDGVSARILIVDDVPENLSLLEIILSRLGYTPVLCADGREAVSLCRQEVFDLILMDIQMPGMNGLDAARHIRADSLNTGTTIIAMTASDQQDDELAALEAGCDDRLNKPINRKLLEQKVRRCVAKKQQIQDAGKGLEITSFLDGDPDYHKTIETFVSNLPGRIEQMRDALNKNDFDELASKIHALKGLGGFAGFAVYTEKAARLEESIRERDIDKIQAQIDEMVQMCMRTKIKTDTK